MEQIRSLDGTPVAFHRLGDGPPLVLVHGTLDDHRYWGPVVDDLARQFSVYALDRRGRGASGPQGDSYAVEREYEDITAVVDAVGEPVHLFGHSAGARYSLHAALHTMHLRSLTLYEPPPFGSPPPEFMERLEVLTAADDREAIVSAFWSDMVGVTAEEIEEMRGGPAWQISLDNAHTLLRELRSFAGYEPRLEELTALQVPSLLLSGSESPPFLREEAEKVAALLPNSRLVVLEGQGHEAVHTAPDLFTRTVTRFLAEH